VAADTLEGVSALDEQRRKHGYPWLVAEPVGGMLRDMEVLVQSTKIAIDSNGVIVNLPKALLSNFHSFSLCGLPFDKLRVSGRGS